MSGSDRGGRRALGWLSAVAMTAACGPMPEPVAGSAPGTAPPSAASATGSVTPPDGAAPEPHGGRAKVDEPLLRALASIASAEEAAHAWCLPTATPPSPPRDSADADAPDRADRERGAQRDPAVAVRVALRPIALPQVRVEVEVRVSAPNGVAGRWRMERPGSGEPRSLGVHDSRGPVAHRLACDADACSLELLRATEGTTVVAYAVRPSDAESGDTAGLVIATDHSYLAADSLVLLPDALDEVATHATLVVDPSGIGAERVATSIGVGVCRQRLAYGRALRRFAVLAGPLGTSVMSSTEGHDEAAWFGYTAFDPRSFAAEVAETRTAMRQFFGDRADTPSTLLLVAHPRPPSSVAVAHRAPSLVGFVGIDERWGAALRLAFAQQLIHHWIGGQLWVGPTDGAHAAESLWFTEGLARHYARELLFRFGQLTAEEVRDEVDALLAVQAASSLAGKSNLELASRASEREAHRLLVARGALYAARTDGLLLRRSNGARSLDSVVASLLQRARKSGSALPTEAWIAAVEAELGTDARAEHTSHIDEGRPIELPVESMGRCFRPSARQHAIFGLGFDVERTRESEGKLLAGLEPQGPAARAGARATDTLERISFVEGRPDVPVELTVLREGKAHTLRYAPIARTVRLRAFDVVAQASRMKCAR